MVFMPHWPKVMGSKPIYYDLERINELMGRLGNPHEKIPPVIHIAGTNGKGSTTAFIRAIMEAAGYVTHVYTSPHLLNFNERIVLAGKEITNDYLTQIMEECRIATGDMMITFFEGTTAGAFLAFSKIKADVVLLETGMGGRLDATNIIDRPAMTVITPISIDHTEYLGPTIPIIAREKAGIMKKGVTCVVSLQTDEADEALQHESERLGANLLSFGYDWVVEKTASGMSFKNNQFDFPDLPPPSLVGDHQIINAGAAIAATLALENFKIGESAIRRGLQSAKWPARMQYIESGDMASMLPDGWEIWVDGAHNEAGAQVLSCALDDLTPKATYFICGFTKGRSAAKFLSHLKGRAKFVCAVIIQTEPNAQNADSIALEAKETGFNSAPFESIEDALHFIGTNEITPGRIIFCGSLYLASDAMKINSGVECNMG
jgi:dihydrofolate synthase/folylpolyglutamate synthase